MNRLVKAQLALESRRSELGKLLDLEERGEDYQGKLEEAKAAVAAAQTDLQTAAQAEPEVQERRQDNPAGAELRALEERANVGELYDSILSHGQPHGAMAELQQHLGLQANQIPLSLITGFEERAVTPAPGQVGQNQQGIIAYVFPQSAASFLGVDHANSSSWRGRVYGFEFGIGSRDASRGREPRGTHRRGHFRLAC